MTDRRDLLLVASGAGVSMFGTMLTTLVLLLSLKEHGPLAVSVVLAAELVPVALGASVVGRLVDRVPNRRLLIVAQVIQAVSVLALVLVLGYVALSALVAFVYGFGTAITKPAATALLPRITGEQDVTRGYAAWGTAATIGMLLGSALGGVLIAGPGPEVALVVDAGTCLVQARFCCSSCAPSAICGATGRRPGGPEAEDRAAGLRYLRADTVLSAITFGGAVMVFATVLVNVAAVFYVTDVLLAGSVALGVMTACWGLGKLIANRIGSRVSGQPALLRLLGLGGVLMGIALITTG